MSSPPNGTFCHSDLEESNNDFIQVFIFVIIVINIVILVNFDNIVVIILVIILIILVILVIIVIILDNFDIIVVIFIISVTINDGIFPINTILTIFNTTMLKTIVTIIPPIIIRFWEVGGWEVMVQPRKVTPTSVEEETPQLSQISMVR